MFDWIHVQSHMFGYSGVSVRYKIFYSKFFIQKKIKTILETFEFHCITASNLIALKIRKIIQ